MSTRTTTKARRPPTSRCAARNTGRCSPGRPASSMATSTRGASQYDDWKSHFDTPAVSQYTLMARFFGERAWQNLVPDQGHHLLTDGAGEAATTGDVLESDVRDRRHHGRRFARRRLRPDGANGRPSTRRRWRPASSLGGSIPPMVHTAMRRPRTRRRARTLPARRTGCWYLRRRSDAGASARPRRPTYLGWPRSGQRRHERSGRSSQPVILLWERRGRAVHRRRARAVGADAASLNGPLRRCRFQSKLRRGPMAGPDGG